MKGRRGEWWEEGGEWEEEGKGTWWGEGKEVGVKSGGERKFQEVVTEGGRRGGGKGGESDCYIDG